MARIPAHIVDDIMNTSRIEEIVGEYVNLKKSGANYKGLSPFTDEKTPSFMVSPAKQIFKCFSSGKGGTVVSFLMEVEQFSYPEALRWLANRYNIEVPEEKPLTQEEKEKLSEKESLQIINNYARDFFVDTITQSEEGKTIGYSYFKERGFLPETIQKFQLGFCPEESKSFTDTAIEKGYKQNYLETLGLTKTSKNRRFDFFHGRVMFPIHSISGKVLGFGGRTLSTTKKVAKYFNSPESPLYNKSNVLYGIYFAKQSIVKYDNCFLVEGYTDVISLSQSGIENVVSSSGTSLTEGQIRLIKRYTENITVLYDSDAAGIKASFRGIDMLLKEGLSVKVVSFPEGDDPDSFAKRVSREELGEYLEANSKDFIAFKTETLLKDSANDPQERAKLIKNIVTSIGLIPNSIMRSVYVKETAIQFDMKEQLLVDELNTIRRQQNKQNSFSPQPKETTTTSILRQPPLHEVEHNDFNSQELDLLRVLIRYGNRTIEVEEDDKTEETSVTELIIQELERDQLSFSKPLYQVIYQFHIDALKNGTFCDENKLLRSENQKVVQLVTDIITSKYEPSDNWLKKYKIETKAEIHQVAKTTKEALYSFKIGIVMRQINANQEQLKTPNNLSLEEEKELLRDQILLQKIKNRFAAELGRIVI